MNDFQIYPFLKISNKKHKILSASENSTIISYDKNSALKIPVSPTYNLIKEFKLQEELFEQGFPIPQPMGIYRLLHTEENPKDAKDLGILMQKIKGIPIKKLPSTLIVNAIRQYENWKSKACSQGFSIPYNNKEGCLYSTEENKIYLFGFNEWTKITN